MTTTLRSLFLVHSDKDKNFTTALAQNASEYETLSLTTVASGEARCEITSIRLLSQQNLAWIVSFHRRSTDSITDFDTNTMIDYWSWAAGDGIAVGSAFLYAVSGLSIPYQDQSQAGNLNIAVTNRSTTAKTATSGGVGHVQVTVGVFGAA